MRNTGPGRYKNLTDQWRNLTWYADIGSFLLPGIAEVASAGATLYAGVKDAQGAKEDGDPYWEGREMAMGAAEAAAVLIPFVELTRILNAVKYLPGCKDIELDVRSFARWLGGGLYDLHQTGQFNVHPDKIVFDDVVDVPYRVTPDGSASSQPRLTVSLSSQEEEDGVVMLSPTGDDDREGSNLPFGQKVEDADFTLKAEGEPPRRYPQPPPPPVGP